MDTTGYYPLLKNTDPLYQIADYTQLMSNALLTPKVLGSNVNLNNMLTSGEWHQSVNTNATLALNYPVATGGLLTVKTYGTYTYQTYWALGASNVIYYRHRYGTTYTAWKIH